MFDFRHGEELEFSYPIRTDVRLFPRAPRRRRRVIVRRIRDLVDVPLTVSEFMRRPLVCRSRWLLQAFDVDLREFRQFYLGTSDEFASPGTLSLAVFEPGVRKPIDFLGGRFSETHKDRKTMMRLIVEWERRREDAIERRSRLPDWVGESIGPLPELRIVADDLRLIA